MPDKATETRPALDDASAQAVLEEARRQMNEQLRAIEGVDQKSERAAALAVAIATGFTAAATLVATQASEEAAGPAVLAALLVAVNLGVVGVLFLKTYAVRTWDLGAGRRDLSPVASGHPSARVKLWLTEELSAAGERNEARLKEKSKWSWRLLAAVGVEAVIATTGLAAAAALELFG